MQEIKKESINIDRSEIWQNRLKWIMPVLAIVLAIIIWELLVKVYDIPVNKYNIKRNEITFLSSNTWDVSGGGNYGYNSVWVNRSQSHFDNLDYHPKNEIGNLSQLLDIV